MIENNSFKASTIENLNTKYTEVEIISGPKETLVSFNRPHPFLKKPITIIKGSETKKIIPTEQIYFIIENQSQKIKNLITEEQTDIARQIINNPNSHSIEILIDQIYVIQRNYQLNSHIQEINFLGGLSAGLISFGIQEDLINQCIQNNNILIIFLLTIINLSIFKLSIQCTKDLSQFLYILYQNKIYNSTKSN